MSKLKVQNGEWVIVCDGKKALILENVGDEKFLNLKTREVLGHPDLKSHELGSDAPGRSFSSAGPGRSAMEQTDLHDQEEQRFLRRLALHLDAEVNAGRVKSALTSASDRKSTRLNSSHSRASRMPSSA